MGEGERTEKSKEGGTRDYIRQGLSSDGGDSGEITCTISVRDTLQRLEGRGDGSAEDEARWSHVGTCRGCLARLGWEGAQKKKETCTGTCTWTRERGPIAGR